MKAWRGEWLLGLCAAACIATTDPVGAHEVRPAFLQLTETGSDVYEVLWSVPGRGASQRSPLQIRLPAACEGISPIESTHTGGALNQQWRVRCPGGLAGREILIEGLAAADTDALVRVEQQRGPPQMVQLTPARPSFRVATVPGRGELLRAYLALGVEHILLGADHLLFVLGLLLIVPGRWMLVKTITAFTVAHSLTLAMATLGYAHAPVEPLNVCIALSILFLGPEIVRQQRGQTSLTLRHPWLVAFAFGLLHGFGFASGLTTLGLPSGEIPLALLMFNVGVELGQLGFVALLLALAWSFKVLEVRWPRLALATPGYAVGALGAWWLLQRFWMMAGGWK